MIIDGFIFYNELDLLEIRLEELYPVVDLFVIVQADKTFRGNAKEIFFDPDDDRWAAYADKILSVQVRLPDFEDPWKREEYQRNIIGIEVGHIAEPEDFVILSDVDEIPARETISRLVRYAQEDPVAVRTPMYYYSLNVRKAGEWGAIRFVRASEFNERTAEEIRKSDPEQFVHGGWHFSYLGDDEFISDKLRAFSHSELDRPDVHDSIALNRASLLDPYNHQERLFLEKFVPEEYPHAVRENPERWSKYLW